jgi:DNA ligase-1
MKPLLADDWIESKVSFPLCAQPKVDGVRALNMLGKITARSLKPFGNRYINSFFSHSALIGFDGEMAAERETHPDLCRLTTSAMSSHNGQPYTLWWLFDYVTVETRELPYHLRFSLLNTRVGEIQRNFPMLGERLRIMPSFEIQNMDMLNSFDEKWLIEGYEGTILRNPNASHKQGRSGTKPILWRIKRFVDFEFTVTEIIEGEENQNAAQINELGLQFRSSHKDNKVANGMIGAMLGKTLTVVKDPTTGAVLFDAGQDVKVGAGCLSHEQRRYYFEHQDEFKSKLHKAKFFPKGIKDKPRFPTWQTFKDPVDIS